MRTFVAIELPQDIQLRIDRLIQRLSRHLSRSPQCGLRRNVRWTPVTKLHLTLRFLGETSPSQQRQVVDLLRALTRESSPVRLCVGQLGCFPNMRSPRVVWLGLGGELSRLGQLQSGVEQIAQHAKYEPESRSYSPHLTIGRVRQGLSGAERRTLGDCLSDLQERESELDAATAPPIAQGLTFDVCSLVLMRSVLKPEGAQYSVIERMPLG